MLKMQEIKKGLISETLVNTVFSGVSSVGLEPTTR
jgi:hypothetical protein